MARKQTDIAHINLRIRENLRRKLEREAKAHQFSLNNEIRLRLEDSFEQQARRDLDSISNDMMANWFRYGERFLALSLEDDLARALEKTTDPDVAKAAKVWLLTRRAARSSGGAS